MGKNFNYYKKYDGKVLTNEKMEVIEGVEGIVTIDLGQSGRDPDLTWFEIIQVDENGHQIGSGFSVYTGEKYVKEKVKEYFNCQKVEIDFEGDIWIKNPQSPHFIDQEEKLRFFNFLDSSF